MGQNPYCTRAVAGESAFPLEFADPIPYKVNTSSDGKTVYKVYDASGRDAAGNTYIFRFVTSTETDSSTTVTCEVALGLWDNRGSITSWQPVSSVS